VAKRLSIVAVLGLSILAALTLGAGSADAGLFGCRYPSSSQPFAQWGDNARYVPVPGGNFEGWSGWRLSGGATITDDNEPFHLDGASDSHSLTLPPGSSAMSPAVCLQVLTPTMRFVGNSSDGSGVRVTMYTRTLFGLLQIPTFGQMTVPTDWDASSTQSFVLQNVLGLLNLSGVNMYFKFTPVGNATVQMDDVYLDPFLMR
jgi:hypothetical protein